MSARRIGLAGLVAAAAVAAFGLALGADAGPQTSRDAAQDAGGAAGVRSKAAQQHREMGRHRSPAGSSLAARSPIGDVATAPKGVNDVERFVALAEEAAEHGTDKRDLRVALAATIGDPSELTEAERLEIAGAWDTVQRRE